MSKIEYETSRPAFSRKRGMLGVVAIAMVVVAGCAQNQLPEDQTRETYLYFDRAVVPVIKATAETDAVESVDDAADDPAIWIHPTDPLKSLVLGTDKKSGIAVYDLSGQQVQFLPAGLPNNIDLRQNVMVGEWSGDIAVSSNRFDNSVTVFSVGASGVVLLGSFPSDIKPYGICLGRVGFGSDEKLVTFVTYKSGMTKGYQIDQVVPAVAATEIGAVALGSQLEGCVHEDRTNTLYIGEEAVGIWRSATGTDKLFSAPVIIDRTGGETGIVADVEGVALYDNGQHRYLIASSQGNDSFAVYDAATPFAFRGRFRIGADSMIDSAQETDGIEANASPLGDLFPEGILVVQDGFNAPFGTPQNFKIVDWRDVAAALNLP